MRSSQTAWNVKKKKKKAPKQRSSGRFEGVKKILQVSQNISLKPHGRLSTRCTAPLSTPSSSIFGKPIGARRVASPPIKICRYARRANWLGNIERASLRGECLPNPSWTRFSARHLTERNGTLTRFGWGQTDEEIVLEGRTPV